MAYFEYGSEEMDYLKSTDKKMKALIEEVGFIKRETKGTLYQGLVISIIGQQISMKAQETVVGRLKKKVQRITPQRMMGLSVEDLQSIGISFRKASYIQEITQKVNSKQLNLASLKKKSDEEVIETLVELKGIGVWTAEMLLLFSLERKDILSYDDLAIRRGLCNLYGHQEITKEQFKKYKKKFSPYGSIASFYLWHISI